MKSRTPNPAGREGKPMSLAPLSFDDALRKILAAPPPPKQEKKTQEATDQKGVISDRNILATDYLYFDGESQVAETNVHLLL